MTPVLIDPPVGAWSPPPEIEAWITKLQTMLSEFAGDPDGQATIRDRIRAARRDLEHAKEFYAKRAREVGE